MCFPGALLCACRPASPWLVLVCPRAQRGTWPLSWNCHSTLYHLEICTPSSVKCGLEQSAGAAPAQGLSQSPGHRPDEARGPRLNCRAMGPGVGPWSEVLGTRRGALGHNCSKPVCLEVKTAVALIRSWRLSSPDLPPSVNGRVRQTVSTSSSPLLLK